MSSGKRHGKNLSPLVDSQDCVKCGAKCCTKFTLQFDRTMDAMALSEVERYRLMETSGKIWVEDTKDYFLVHFDFPCSQLTAGQRCMIYEDNARRPMLCRTYPAKEDVECRYKKKKRSAKKGYQGGSTEKSG
ncbi:MAG: YkgJ family cysteine cluster protein [Candidatus Altiarchaeota archaeon]|nr:YkgJ family cysteine cluster protein [Candidatus Altiarchaeota archaeon]